MELWIARDKDNTLKAYTVIPARMPLLNKASYFAVEDSNYLILDSKLFPEITWENSPRKVKIELI